MADHVSDAGVKLVAYLLVFLAAVFSVMALMTATFDERPSSAAEDSRPVVPRRACDSNRE